MKSKVLYYLKELFCNTKAFVKSVFRVKTIKRIVNGETYYPEKKRKSVLRRYLDMYRWIFLYSDINYFYNSYGLDIKGSKMKEYLSVDRWFRYRDYNNFKKHRAREIQVPILHNKIYFASYMGTVLPDKIPETVMAFENGRAVFGKGLLSENLKEKSSLFVKSAAGECGDGVYKADYKDGEYYLNRGKVTPEKIDSICCSGKWIVQKTIVQHRLLDEINPYSINTLRIVSVKNSKNEINILATILRMGTKSDLVVDNCALGGTYSEIGTDGKMRKFGYYEPNKGYGTKTDRHPVSGVVFEGFLIPYYHEAIELVKMAHGLFDNMQSIGWDIAISESGPVIIEGNENYEMEVMQEPCGGLKKRWNELTK